MHMTKPELNMAGFDDGVLVKMVDMPPDKKQGLLFF